MSLFQRTTARLQTEGCVFLRDLDADVYGVISEKHVLRDAVLAAVRSPSRSKEGNTGLMDPPPTRESVVAHVRKRGGLGNVLPARIVVCIDRLVDESVIFEEEGGLRSM